MTDNVLAVILIVLAGAASLLAATAYSVDRKAKHDHEDEGDEEK